MNKRKICVVVYSRANYGRIKSVLEKIKKSPLLELQLIVGASALLYRFGNVREVIERDGFEINAFVHSIVEGETPTTMAKSTGLAIMELSTILDNIKPDIVLTVADRYETMSTAIAASYMNIPLAHTQGGEVTGSIDESVRHAITKLAHIHFPATKRAYQYLLRLGENPTNVFLTGCPALDFIDQVDLTLPADIFSRYKGVGADLDIRKPYLLVLQHPVTTEYGAGFDQINETLESLYKFDFQVVWLWPNVDAGSDGVSKGIRQFREKHHLEKFHFYRNFSTEDYLRLMSGALCQIGNSSSALREGSYLGLPVVNIGSRQSLRLRSENVIDVDYDRHEITSAIKKQLSNGRYKRSHLFGDGDAGTKIVRVLEKINVDIQKKLHYVYDAPVMDDL